MTSQTILGYAYYSKPFTCMSHTDASSKGLWAVLYQEQYGKLKVIAYASHGLRPSERITKHIRWSVCFDVGGLRQTSR